MSIAPQTIYKYSLELSSIQNIKLPTGAEILSVQLQHGQPQLWAIVTPRHTEIERTFEVFATYEELSPLSPNIHRTHLATLQIGAYVWHVFERKAINIKEILTNL